MTHGKKEAEDAACRNLNATKTERIVVVFVASQTRRNVTTSPRRSNTFSLYFCSIIMCVEIYFLFIALVRLRLEQSVSYLVMSKYGDRGGHPTGPSLKDGLEPYNSVWLLINFSPL
jgi:hypothetical protein